MILQMMTSVTARIEPEDRDPEPPHLNSEPSTMSSILLKYPQPYASLGVGVLRVLRAGRKEPVRVYGLDFGALGAPPQPSTLHPQP